MYSMSALKDYSDNHIYIFHTHDIVNTRLPRSKYICTIRNPYDICASYYQFTKCNIDKAIIVAKGHFNLTNIYKQIKSKNILINRYEDIDKNPLKAINELADFVDIKISSKQISRIESMFNKTNVQSRINYYDDKINKKIKSNEAIDPENVIIFNDKNIRAFDPQTSFQTGHISDRKIGEWRKVFTPNQIKLIIDNLDEIALLLGYKSEEF